MAVTNWLALRQRAATSENSNWLATTPVGEFWADAKTGRLISAGLLCNDASNLIHLPAYAIDHEHTIYQLKDAEFYHPTKMEIVAEIGDTLRRQLGDNPFARADE